MPRQPVTRLFLAALITASLTLPALAEPTNPNERSSLYGETRSWLVEALQDESGFSGCRATIPLQPAGPLLLERTFDAAEGWTMYVPSPLGPDEKGSTTAPGLFIVDGEELPVTYELLGHGWAAQPLTEVMRQRLMDGNYFGAAVDGDEAREWILNGSTAAMDLAQECYERQGAVWR